MENAADALKIGFGIFVFILAITVLFQTMSLVKTTTDAIMLTSDKTTYYTYVVDDNSTGKDENDVIYRIVTLEDMIPTIYRYSIESYGVTIIDTDGNIVTRFDKDTETLCESWGDSTETEKNKLRAEINTYVLDPVNANKITNKNGDNKELLDLFKRIYGQEENYVDQISFSCDWIGDENLNWSAQRIDSDLFGETAYFSYNNPGVQGTKEQAETNREPSHIPCINGGIIKNYKDKTFREYVITHDGNVTIRDEDGTLYYIGDDSGQERRTIKREIIYVEI